MSASHHGEPGLISLLPQSVNFSVLLAFLIWKLKKPLHDYFVELRNSTKDLHQKALSESEQANKVLEDAKHKKENLEKAKGQFSQEQEHFFQEYKKSVERSFVEKNHKLRQDLDLRLVNLREQLLKGIHEEFVNSIVDKVSEEVQGDPSSSKKLTTVLMKDFNV